MERIYLGNIYGLHDGYDGNVFDPNGVSMTIMANHTNGGGMIIEIDNCRTHREGNRKTSE